MPPRLLSRRTFLASSLLAYSSAAVPTALAGAWGYNDLDTSGYTGSPRIEHLKLYLSHLPEELDGYTIGYLTDIHLGIWVPDRWLHNALTVLAKQEVDLVLLGGDYIYVDENPLWPAIGMVRNWSFAGLERRIAAEAIYARFIEIIEQFSFPDGIYGVPGNHDHWNEYPIFNSVVGSSNALRILVNEGIIIERNGKKLEIFGTDDFLTGFPAPPPERREAIPRIVLSHNPDYIAWSLQQRRNDFDAALCGHTHGGQIRIPGLGAVAAQVDDSRFISGKVEADGSTIYTSRGLGVVGLPWRVACPPEITIVTLASSKR